MISWIEIALAVLKLINSLVTWAKERELISEGQRQELAQEAIAIAAKVHTRDQILEKVNALSDADVDSQLRGLEPK